MSKQRTTKEKKKRERASAKATKSRTPSRVSPKTSHSQRGLLFWQQLTAVATQETGRFIVGLILFVASVVVLFSVLSYFFTAHYDQSIIFANNLESEQLEELRPRNIFSFMGAWLGYYLVDCFMGVGVLALLVIPFLLSLKLIGVLPKVRLGIAFIKCSLLAITISLLAYLISLPLREVATFLWGGQHGEYVGGNIKLYAGVWGLALLVVLLLFIDWVLFIPKGKSSIRQIFTLEWLKRKEKERIVTQDNPLENEQETDSHDPEGVAKTPKIATTDDEETPPLEETESKLIVEVAGGDGGDVETSSLVQVRDQYIDSELEGYRFPTPELLREDNAELEAPDMTEIRANEQLIIDTLESFKIKVTPIKATVGPTVTLYEIEPDAGIKISRIRNLEDDIALNLKADGIRIIAPIPGKGTIGIEVPNKKPRVVMLQSLITSKKFVETKMELPVALGRTITNEVFMFDLTKMPHLLIAGATGQGKSVGMNVIITSLLYAKHPSELKFVMIDPKILEFSIYNDLEHHFFARIPTEEKCIITDTDKVIPTLLSLCEEMDNRYHKLTEAKVRNIAEYNEAFQRGELEESQGHARMPYIVLVVDEFADLIMTGGKEIERPIARLAQKARAAGIHMILATQRPTTDVVTGTIKANFPARIAFKVFSAVDSRTILDSTGANRLVGRGDMLFYQGRDMIRLQCAFVDTPETQKIVDYIAQQPGFTEPYPLPIPSDDESSEKASLVGEKLDPLFETVARSVVSSGQGSTSKIQRDFEIGFNRAGRLMDQLERAGIVGKQMGSKPREVLVQDLDHLNQILYNIRLSS